MISRSAQITIRIALAIAFLSVAAPAHAAAQLVMFESASCVWCIRWHADIGPAYPKTQEGRCAPLRRVDIGAPLPADLKIAMPVKYTPTFVVVADGHEVSRLVGYPGEDFFWPLLAERLAKLPGGCPN